MATSPSTRFRMPDDVVRQGLGAGEDTVVLSLRSGQLFTCNETTAAFLQAVDGTRTLGEIIGRLHEKFDAPRATLDKDMTELAEKLLAEGLIVASP